MHWNITLQTLPYPALLEALGKKEDAEMFYKRSLGYKHYYSKEFGTFPSDSS